MNNSNKNKAEEMSDHEFDQLFKSHLEDHEVTPNSSNWKRINQWTGFSIFYSFSKYNLLKIAATLLLLITAGSFYFQYQNQINSSTIAQTEVKKIDEAPVEVEEVQVLPVEEKEFVFDFKKDETDKELKKELIDKKLDDYLAFLLEDEDEFASIIDSSEISKSLAPVEQLPIDEMFAYIPSLPKQEEITILAPLETKITLPHRFVKSEKEIEDFLTIYESNKRSD